MKQALIVLILLFAYTVQNKIHSESSKNEKSNRGHTHFPIFKRKCETGYVFECREVAINKDTLKPLIRCGCFKENSKEKKVGITPKKNVDLTERAKTEKFKPKAPSTTKNIKCPKGYVYAPEFDFKTGLHFRCVKISKDKTTKLYTTKINTPIKTKKCEEGYFYYCEPIKGMYMHDAMPKRKCYCKKKEEKN